MIFAVIIVVFLGRLLWVDQLQPVSASFHPTTNCGRWLIHNGMPYDLIQGQGCGGQKVAKWLISKSISSTSMHVIKRLMVNYDTARPHLNFNWTDFWYSSLFGVTWCDLQS